MPSPLRSRRGIAAVAVAALAVGLTGLLAAVSGPAVADGTDLIADPGFEAGLTGWTCDAGTATTVSAPAHSGSHALAATPTAADDAQCGQSVSVAPNSTYTLTADVQGSYVYLGATGTGVNASTWTPSANSYQQLSVTFTTGASTTSVSVFVHGWYAEPTYYADDVGLTGPPGGGGTTTTAPPPDTGWSHPVYLMPLANNPPSISDIVAGSGEKELNLAFVLDAGGCTPAWDGDSGELVSTDTAVAAQINAIRAAGGDAAVSFGGYNGTELGSTCGGADALAAAYQQVITKYQLKHVDFDYENTALDSDTAVRFGAIAMLEKNNPGLVVSAPGWTSSTRWTSTPA